MKTDIGEYIVGAYLKIVEHCDVVDYNVRPRGGKLEGLNELDVVGLRFKDGSAFICEVVTHIRGTLYKDYKTTIKKITAKHQRQKKYASSHLANFSPKYMLWSPVVPSGLCEKLNGIDGLACIVNEDYSRRIAELRIEARTRTNDEGNPFFRTLQILEHLREVKTKSEPGAHFRRK